MTMDEMIRAVQQALGVTVDGCPGPETWCALYARLVGTGTVAPAAPAPAPAAGPAAPPLSEVDARSEAVIATLQPQVRPLARALVQKAAQQGIRIKILSGFRSYEEQGALYAQGRTTPGRVVTNARPGYSNHNFGIAFDVGVFEGTRYLGESPKYKAVGALGQDLGLEWGGSWATLVDEPHFQLRPAWATAMRERDMLAALRSRVASGDPVYA